MPDGLTAGAIDVRTTVLELMKLEQGKLRKLEKSKSGLDIHLSTYGNLTSLLETLTDKMDALSTTFGNPNTVASSNPQAVTASLDDDVQVNPGTHTITVGNLATSQTTTSQKFSSPLVQMGVSETLNFQIGSNNYSVPIGPLDTLQTVCDNINVAVNNTNLQATILCVGANQYQLVITSDQTGAANAITITGDTNNVFNFTTPVPAADATFTFDGITINRPSNTITDVIDGLSFQLVAPTASGATVNLTISTDPEFSTNLTTGMQDIINAYNAIVSFIDKTQADRDTQDDTLSGIKTMLQNVVLGSFSVSGSSFKTLTDVGINLSKPEQQKFTKIVLDKNGREKKVEITYTVWGKLEINDDPDSSLPTFQNNITTNLASLQAFFTDSVNGFINILENNTIDDVILSPAVETPQGTTVPGTIPARNTQLNQQVRTIKQRIQNEEDRLEGVQAGLFKKYTKLNVLLAGFERTRHFLENQLASISATSMSYND